MPEPTRYDRPWAQIVIVGGGVMGSGIAAAVVGHGLDAVVVEPDPAVRSSVEAGVRQHIRTATLHGRLHPAACEGDLEAVEALPGMIDAAMAIEAVVEDVAVKREVLRQLTTTTASDAPVVTTTSSIPIAELTDGLDAAERVVGVHFMNPPLLKPVVEMARTGRTADSVVDAVQRILGVMAFQGVVVGDSPGFVTSRLLHSFINEATRIVDEGVADAETVDLLTRACLGHQSGPLEIGDLIGLDNLVDSLSVLTTRLGRDDFTPASGLIEKVRAGHWGRKTGRGYHLYGAPAVHDGE